MRSTEEIQIPLSKRKMILLLIGSAILVMIGISFVIDPESYVKIGRDSTTIFIGGVAGILFFGVCALYILRRLFDNKPGLIIDKIGLTDNSSGVAAGQILWTDIRNISVVEIHRQKLLMLDVKNPQEYIDKQTNVFKKKMMQMNLSMYGTPLSISSNALQIKFDVLLNLLNEHLNASRQ